MTIDLYLNLTHYCNVDCYRCYLSKEEREKRTLLEPDHIKTFLSDETIQNVDSHDIKVSWLGGEVTTIPVDKLVEYRQIIRELLPNSKNILITNCYAVTKEHLRFIKETFDGVDTTYAEGGKASLSGSVAKYKERFIDTLKKYNDAGIEVFVNVELNDHTIQAGHEWLFDIAEKTGQKLWEFDISVQFDKVHKLLNNNDSSLLDSNGYPSSIPLTISYKEWEDYVGQFIKTYDNRCQKNGIKIGFLQACIAKDHDPFFSTGTSGNLLTLAADGTIYGTPIHSGIRQLSFGHITTHTVSEVLVSAKRLGFLESEIILRQQDSICDSCNYRDECKSGFSSAPVEDGSGVCVGMQNLRSYIDTYYRKLKGHYHF